MGLFVQEMAFCTALTRAENDSVESSLRLCSTRSSSSTVGASWATSIANAFDEVRSRSDLSSTSCRAGQIEAVRPVPDVWLVLAGNCFPIAPCAFLTARQVRPSRPLPPRRQSLHLPRAAMRVQVMQPVLPLRRGDRQVGPQTRLPIQVVGNGKASGGVIGQMSRDICRFYRPPAAARRVRASASDASLAMVPDA
jgi:hypothetical protein